MYPRTTITEDTLELVLLILMAKLEMPLRWTSLLETGDYKLSFVYSAAVDGTPKRDLYINAYGYDSISFPATSNWEEWNTSETTVHLRAGIQRMVVYCNNADDGYINFDCVHISKSA